MAFPPHRLEFFGAVAGNDLMMIKFRAADKREFLPRCRAAVRSSS
jgi:hypothetical protein